MTGILYIVATPIGNLEDISLRALRILKEVNLIAAEDTRQTSKLLNHYQIKNRLISYHAHNLRKAGDTLIRSLLEGQHVALVSDAGTPGISDPGSRLVSQALQQGIRVVPIPGASAVVAALSASGVDTSEFFFAGFLPIKPGRRINTLKRYKEIGSTLVVYESPHRLTKTLAAIQEVWGDDVTLVLAKELTKIYESFLRGRPADLLASLQTKPPKGEWLILISPGP